MVRSQIQVDIQFNARTERAKQQLKELQGTLTHLSTAAAGTQLGITPQIKEATQSAMNLQTALKNATNVNTGQLNLNKFQAELNKSGMTLQQYAAKLKALGPEGAKAFSQLAISINQASTSMFSLSAGAKSMMDTLFSSAQWTLAYGAINMVTQAIQQTITYAKELDEALTDIRIVTGYSTQYMKDFADEASRAAKELKTTTTEYAKGALIYYQQGLSGAEVQKRTETTIKLANVLGKSTETVSDWMTAIWNNFDDGSKSLEYNADVLAKLGAATASSADEIAGGLEKFAAVAEAIGLSYEYAASMLTTITAETRQSEEVVGTALKTILSRMEGLKLGDSLDDGTTLNKYSSALLTVGVNIKNANDELKNMDQILSETGEKWSLLNRDQQVALAQTVAGVRQYTQFIALMDNWDVMKENLEMAEGATGELNKQYQIYEGSVAAAEKRVKESLNSIKASFLGTDDLAKLNNNLSDSLEIVADLVDGFGGLRTIILMASAALTKMYQPQLAGFFNQMVVSIRNIGPALKAAFTGKGSAFSKMQKEATVTAQSMLLASSSSYLGGFDSNSTELMTKEVDVSKQLVSYSHKLSELDRVRLEQESAILSKKSEIIVAQEKELQNESKILAQKMDYSGGNNTQRVSEQVGTAEGHLGVLKDMSSVSANTGLSGKELKKYAGTAQGHLDQVKTAINKLGDEFSGEFNADINTAEEALKEMANTGVNKFDEFEKIIDRIRAKMADMGTAEIKAAAEEDIMHKEVGIDSHFGDNLNTVSSPDEILQTTQTMLKHPQAQQVLSQEEIGTLQNYSQQAQELATFNTEHTKTLTNLQESKQAWLDNNGLVEKNGKLMTKNSKGQLVNVKNGNKLQKTYQNFNKQIDEQQNLLDDNTKKTKNLGGAVQKITGTFKKGVSQIAKNTKGYQQNTKELENNGKANRQNTANMVKNQKAASDLGKNYDVLSEDIANSAFATKHWSDRLAGSISTFTNVAMGLSMITGGIESVTEAALEGDLSLSSLLSSVMSIGFGLLTLIPIFGKISTLMSDVYIKQQIKSIKLSELGVEQDNKETRTKLKNMVYEVMMLKQQGTAEEYEQKKSEARGLKKIAFQIAEQAAAGPYGWATAALSAAAVMAIIGVSIGVGVNKGRAKKQENQKEDASKKVEESKETLEEIDELQELNETVLELAESYDRLRSSGKGYLDILKQMKEEVPDLIEKYEDLQDKTGVDMGLQALRNAWNTFVETGKVEDLIAALEYSEGQANKAENTANKTNADSAVTAAQLGVGSGANRNKGRMVGNNLEVRVGGDYTDKNSWAKDLVKVNVPGVTFSDNNRIIKLDLSTPQAILETYKGLEKALGMMQERGYDNTRTYKRLYQQFQELGDYVGDVELAQENSEKSGRADFADPTSNRASYIQHYALGAGVKFEDLTISNYRDKREKVIEKMMSQYSIDRETAITWLETDEKTAGLERGLTLFAGQGELHQALKGNGDKLSLTQVEKWYESLSPEDQLLFGSLDFTTIDSMEEAQAALDALQADREFIDAITKLEEFDIDEATFEAYANEISKANKELEENKALLYQVSLQTIKLDKGLNSLRENWDDIYEKLY